MKLRVCLNGTKENPYHRYGLKQNPIPQLGIAQYNAACMRLQKLGGDPIPSEQYIRETLARFSPEFVDLVCSKFKPGEYVRFEVIFGETK